MGQDRLALRLMATFIGELEGHVQAFEQDLLALERNPPPDARAELFGSLLRAAHSLKGAARSVRVELVETASHRLEEVFIAVRDGDLAIDERLYNVLLPAVDAIGDAARRLRAGETLDDGPLAAAMPRLAQLAARELLARGRTSPGASTRTSGTEPGAARPSDLPTGTSPLPRARFAESAHQVAAGATPDGEPTAAKVMATRPAADAVRVSNERLDSLLRQSGELLIIRHRAETRSADATRLQDGFAEWRQEWRNIERELTHLLKSDGQAEESAVNDGANGTAARRRNRTELAINRSRDELWRLERTLQHLAMELRADRRVIDQTAVPLDTMVRQTRMLPFAEACAGLERAVRDLAAGSTKKIELEVEGGDIELDRVVLESIRDPLLHLVRNAVDHGIELPSARRAASKPETGRITISAALRGTRVEIKVGDDGKGLDIAAIAERFRNGGVPVPADEYELARGIFQPGFSTSPTVTRVSGRGVGLDIVRTQLTAIRGSVDVSFEPGAGAIFTLSVPLTLSSIRAVMVGIGSELYAIETASVERVLRVGAEDVKSIGGRDMLMLMDKAVPVISLAEALGLPARLDLDTGKVPALALTAEGRMAVVVVDTLEVEREIVVRALGARIAQVRYILGGTILPDGRISLILNAADLVERAFAQPSALRFGDAVLSADGQARKRLLVVDDSATIRTLEKSILEAAGYDVIVASDGQEAWHLLLEVGADLVVSDVEMPRMDGFALTETIRSSPRFRTLPVILVTAMESDADKARGLAVGATAYRPKSAFDQTDLLATIEQIL